MTTANAGGKEATRSTGDRLQGWSVVAVGLLLGAQPLLLVAFNPDVGPVTMSPPLLAAGGIAVAGALLRRLAYTSDDILVVTTWVAAAAMVFAVVIAISVFTIFDGSVGVGATATAFMTPIGAGAGLLAGYSDARRRREHRRGRRTRLALEETTDGVAIVDDGGFTTVNRAYAEMHGYDDPGAMAGRTWETCYPDHERRRLESEAMPRLADGEAWRGETTGQRADGETFPQELTLTPIEDGGHVCVVRDISDRRERERRLRRQTRRLRTVVENAPILLFAVDAAGVIIFIEGAGLSRFGLEGAELEGRSVFDLGIESEGFASTARRALGGEPGHATVRLGERVLKAWFIPVFDEADEIDRVIGATMDITDRYEREQRLADLHRASRRLTHARTRAGVAESAVVIAREMLEMPVSALWRYVEETEQHHPVAMTDAATDHVEADRAEELPPIADDDPAMVAFREGKTRRIEEGAPFDDRLETVAAVPLGEEGVMVVGRRGSETLDEVFRRGADILGLNAGAALARADREELLRERSQELETRASRMEFVNSVIRHDVSNGITVIRSRSSVLTDELEGQESEFAETIVEWCDDIAGLLDRVETVLATLSDGDGVDLQTVDAAAVVREEFARLDRTYSDVTFESDLPGTVPVRADDVLTDVVRNVATNAVSHNDVEGLVVSASAAVGEDRTTVRIADNGTGIPPDRQDAVFGRGESSRDSTGSGFGLFFVEAMVDAYDGEVRVENDDGATIVIELPTGAADAVQAAPERGERS